MRPTPVATPGTLTPGPPAGRIGSGADRARDWCIAGVLALHTFDVVLAVGASGAALPQAFEGHSVATIPADTTQFPAVDGTPLIYVTASVEAPALRDLLEALMAAPLTDRAVLLIEGAGEPERRAEIDAVHLEAWSKVIGIDLDLLPARMRAGTPGAHELVGGLGYVETDAAYVAAAHDPRVLAWYPTVHLLRRGRDLVRDLDQSHRNLPAVPEELREEHVRTLRAEISTDTLVVARAMDVLREEHRRMVELYLAVVNSSSWKLTAPLRLLASRWGRSQ